MGKNVLIAEDDKNIGNLIREIVERKGNNAVVTANGSEAYEIFSNIKFDLLITDLKMPKLDGMNLIKLIREKNKSIPIIIITGYGSERNRKLAENYGVVKFLSKPCSITDITLAIDQSLSPS
jgi:DNA-binding response OmpR family regulator